jgi:transcriptional regulator with XRE-family HTH domain
MHTLSLTAHAYDAIIQIMAGLGDMIRSNRLARKWSLRQLADQIGVTPAYVADLEAERRLPGNELKEKLAVLLGMTRDQLEEADDRLSGDLRAWVDERPQVVSLLRSLRTSPQSEKLVQRLNRFLKRYAPPAVPRGFLLTWESELRAIASEASAWSIETGGDLFGRWLDIPTVLLATKAGPEAKRDHAHFRLDVDYLRTLSEDLATNWALRYFGDWHSHHRLGLTTPSGGDQKRIVSLAAKNQFHGMTEIIVTLEEGRGEPLVRIHPWIYELPSGDGEPYPLKIKVLAGVSPIRQALLSRRVLPEQELFAWEKISLARIRIGNESAAPTPEPAIEVDPMTRERVLSHLAEALREASGDAVELHGTGFGCVLVANLNESECLGFALGSQWPTPLLEVHRIDRRAGSTEPIPMPSDVVAPDIKRIVEFFKAQQRARKRGGSVDQ